MNLTTYAKAELNRIPCEDEESVRIQKQINRGIMAVVKAFADQGHSGETAPYALQVLNRLLNFKPLLPLTGEDSEWDDISDYAGENRQQNNRCFTVFRKDNDNSTAWDSDGKIFSEDGVTWKSTRESNVPIVFPYNVPAGPERVIVKNEG